MRRAHRGVSATLLQEPRCRMFGGDAQSRIVAAFAPDQREFAEDGRPQVGGPLLNRP